MKKTFNWCHFQNTVSFFFQFSELLLSVSFDFEYFFLISPQRHSIFARNKIVKTITITTIIIMDILKTFIFFNTAINFFFSIKKF